MKIPKARRLPSGTWFIQLRLGGQSVPVTARTERACIRDATRIKADYAATQCLQTAEEPDSSGDITLTAAMDEYITAHSHTLSPSTIRGYRAIQKHRFQSTMSRQLADIRDAEWQSIINQECACAAPKTVANAWRFVRSVIKYQTGHRIPPDAVQLPDVPPSTRAFLPAEEIPIFVDAIKDTRVAVAALLALSSLRISEISALRWEDIPPNPDFIRVQGAVVRSPDSGWVQKRATKNQSSTRNVPILIPELAAAIERDRQPSGPVMSYDQDTLRQTVHKTCQKAGITDVTVHGLRHSFASLANHLKMPEELCMEIGGWSDPDTMRRIYTHISKSDISRYQTAMADFYSHDPEKQNANENANTVEKS